MSFPATKFGGKFREEADKEIYYMFYGFRFLGYVLVIPLR